MRLASKQAFALEIDSLEQKIKIAAPLFFSDGYNKERLNSAMLDYLLDKSENKPFNDYIKNQKMLDIGLAHHSLICAEIALESGDARETIKHLCEGNFSIGVLYASHVTLGQNAKKAAEKMHVENKESKDQAIKYYLEHCSDFRNKDDAALAITKIVPMQFSTIRGWLKGI
jgi:hypothetical protein